MTTAFPFVLAWWAGGTEVGEWKELVGTYATREAAKTSGIARDVEKMGYTTKVFRWEDVESHGFPETLK